MRNIDAVKEFKKQMMDYVANVIGIALKHSGEGLLTPLTPEAVEGINAITGAAEKTFSFMETMARNMDSQNEKIEEILVKMNKIDRIDDTTEDIYKKIVQKKNKETE